MKLLLDTHVLVWLAEGSAELRAPARRAIEHAAGNDGLLVSPISFWEIAMLQARGRVVLSAPIRDWRRRVLQVDGLTEDALDTEVLLHSTELPGELHGDPSDRMLVATARIRECRLMTLDRALLEYGRAGHVATVSA